MRKLFAIAFGLLLTSTAFSFSGAGTDRAGNVVDATQNVSRYAKTTKGCGIGASQRDNLYRTKCKTRYTRMSTRSNTSTILKKNAPKYRASKANSETPTAKPLTWFEMAQKRIKERREAKLLKNTQ